MVRRNRRRDERNRVNICELVFFNPMLLINFTSSILRLQLRQASSLPHPPTPHPPALLVSLFLPLPMFLLTLIFPVFSFTSATCNRPRHCIVFYQFAHLVFNRAFDATFVGSFLSSVTQTPLPPYGTQRPF